MRHLRPYHAKPGCSVACHIEQCLSSESRRIPSLARPSQSLSTAYKAYSPAVTLELKITPITVLYAGRGRVFKSRVRGR